jgi:hypothetical protein
VRWGEVREMRWGEGDEVRWGEGGEVRWVCITHIFKRSDGFVSKKNIIPNFVLGSFSCKTF